MNKINYKESIDLKEHIKDLLLINIDDNIEQISEDDFLNISGEIKISGEVQTDNNSKSFSHEIKIDISLSKEQLSSERVEINIDDFSYKINDTNIDIDLYLKLDGLKEIEAYFPTQEDKEIIEVRDIEEIKNDVVIETNSNEEDDIASLEIIPNTNDNYSLLGQVFKNRNIKKEKAFLIHVVKNESNYEEIASLYNVDYDLLKSINNDKEILRGKLIFIPNSK